MTERFAEQGFQFCVLDPEGDYEELENVVMVGDARHPPSGSRSSTLLRKPANNVVVNMLGLKIDERPDYFAKLLPELASLRARTGRPHWLIIDEAHHLLPAARDGASLALPQSLTATILITVHPDLVSPDVLADVETVMALGPEADKVIATFAELCRCRCPRKTARRSTTRCCSGTAAGKARSRRSPSNGRCRRASGTSRKYAEGDLGDHSFLFTGPEGKLKLKAQNLMIFLQIAEGIDDASWEHHLRAGDYSAWFRDKVKDPELADEAAAIEEDEAMEAAGSREAIIDAVLRRYTVPAD